MIRVTTLVLIVILLSCEKTNDKFKLENKESIDKVTNDDKIIVIAHRGDWRHAPENSLQAIQNCIDMGIDMVEIDVRMTKDSVLVLMHDETIDRTTTGKGRLIEWSYDSLQMLYLRNGANHPTHHKIPTLMETMQLVKGHIMVNLDKCYPYFNQVYKILKATETTEQAVMKGRIPYSQVQMAFGAFLDEVKFMPIISLDDPEAGKLIDEYVSQMDPYAIEFIFASDTSSLIKQFADFREKNINVWVNALWESLNAGYEDDMAVINPDSIYGWYIDNRINMIQTDRPAFLLKYLKAEGLHD